MDNIEIQDYSLFGKDSAEDDSNLHMYFVETGTYREVKNQEKLIVVGRKGSGKSAIFHSLKDDKNILYIKILPKKYSDTIFREFIKKYKDTPLSCETSFAAAWKYTILRKITHQLKSNNMNFPETNVVESTMDILDCWANHSVKLVNIQEFANQDLEQINDDVISDLRDQLDITLIRDKLKNGKIHILIDDLDNVWENSFLSSCYIYGLISCARDLIREHNLHVTIFIREDIFSNIQTNFHQIDNIRQQIEPINWNPQILKQMVGKRIQRYFDIRTPGYISDNWYFIMPETIGTMDSFKYMVERTQLRPRELLQFCGVAWNIARKFKKDKIRPIDIAQAETIYSAWKLDDLCSEYKSRYTNLQNLFDAFAGLQPRLKKDEIIAIIKDVLHNEYIKRSYDDDTSPITEIEVTKFLYECGFLRARVQEGDKNKFIASSSVPRLNLSLISSFDIHPAYRKTICRSNN